MVQLQRCMQHGWASHWQLHRAFPPASLLAIEGAIGAHEVRHAGEIRFAVEAGLGLAAAWQGQSARERALEVFSQLRIWDTEHNNGVLIYVLLADHAVEIVADRGVCAATAPSTWDAICKSMEMAFAHAHFREGALAGIGAVSELLAQQYPHQARHGNELPNAPVIL